MKIEKFLYILKNCKNERTFKYYYKIFKLIVNLYFIFFCNINTNGVDETSDVIISLTSYSGRIRCVDATIKTLLRQTYKPRKVILWLSKDEFEGTEMNLPRKLVRLKRYGLDIRFCEDLKPHKKYYYAMKEYSEYNIVVVDDDMFYPENLVEQLYELQKNNPNSICCEIAHKIKIDSEKKSYEAYNLWEDDDSYITTKRWSLIPIGCGGVLYPPDSLDSRVFDEKMIKERCINADDLWLKWMAVLKGTQTVRVSGRQVAFFNNIKSQGSGLFKENVLKNGNDEVVHWLNSSFPEVLNVICGENDE